MLRIFKQDPNKAIAGTKVTLEQAEAAVTQLLCEREALLLESEAADATADVDRRLASARSRVAACHDRVALLEREASKSSDAERETQREAAISKMRKPLERRQVAAVAIERLIGDLGAQMAEFKQASEAIAETWPFDNHALSACLNFGPFLREVGHALHAAGRPDWDKQPFMPAPAAPVLVAGLEPRGVAGHAAETAAKLIRECINARIS